jgi:hypothetical protein
MHLELKGLAVGEARELEPDELELLFKSLEGSRKDSEKAVRNDQAAKLAYEKEQSRQQAKKEPSKKRGNSPDKAAMDLEYAAILKEAQLKERKRMANHSKPGGKPSFSGPRKPKGGAKKPGGRR